MHKERREKEWGRGSEKRGNQRYFLLKNQQQNGIFEAIWNFFVPSFVLSTFDYTETRIDKDLRIMRCVWRFPEIENIDTRCSESNSPDLPLINCVTDNK